MATLGRSQKMINPYEPPESDEGRGVERPDTERSKTGNAAPFVGCGVGGCLVPLLLFIACMVFLGDPGGPLLSTSQSGHHVFCLADAQCGSRAMTISTTRSNLSQA